MAREIGIKEEQIYILEAIREKFGSPLPLKFENGDGINDFCRKLIEENDAFQKGTIKRILGIVKAFDNAEIIKTNSTSKLKNS